METLIIKQSIRWNINNSLLYQKILKRGKKPEDYISNRKELNEYILKDILNNKKYFKYIVSACKKKAYYDENFTFLYDSSKDSLVININNKTLLEFLTKHKYLMKNLWQKKYYEKLKKYSTKEYFVEQNLLKKGEKGLSYLKILELIKQDPEEFKKNNFYYVQGRELFLVLAAPPFCLANRYNTNGIRNRMEFTKEELANIEANFAYLEYNYEPDNCQGTRFLENRFIVDKFSLNEQLKNEILSELPRNYSKLQKAYYIYRRLCQKFSYDPEYYIDSAYKNDQTNINHFDINRLGTLENNQEIICGEISLVYAKFLDMLNIPFQILDYDDLKIKKFNGTHMKVKFKVDEFVIDADAATGIFNSDLSREKSMGQVRNFKLKNTARRFLDIFDKETKEVDMYIEKNSDKLEYKDAIKIYKLMQEKELPKEIPVADKIELLEDAIVENKLKFIDMINWTQDVKEKLFGENEDYCKVEFIVNTIPTNMDKRVELAALIIHNNGSQLDETSFKNTYDIIKEDRSIERLSINDLRQKFKIGEYYLTDPSRTLPGIVEGEKDERKDNRRNKK